MASTSQPEDTQTDYAAFEGTRAVGADAQPFDIAALTRWLTQHVEDFAGPLTLEQFNDGQSNPTFKLVTSRRAAAM